MSATEPSLPDPAVSGTVVPGAAGSTPPEDGLFITAIRHNEGPVVINDPAAMDRTRQLHAQLTGVVTTLNDKVRKRLRSQAIRLYT